MDIHGSSNEEKRILVIKLRYIGDTVLTTPLLKVLKSGVPGSRIDVLVYDDSQEVLVGNPFVDRVWTLNHARARKSLWYSLTFMGRLRGQGYHTVVDLTNNDRSSLFTFFTGAPMRIGFVSGRWFRTRICYTEVIDSLLGQGHAVDHHLKVAELLGLPAEDRHPHIQVSVEAQKRVEAKLIEMGFDWNQPFVLIYPGARRWYKRWPPEQFSALADRISHHFQMSAVFCGGKEDVAISESIRGQMVSEALDVTGRLSLSEFAALIQRAACLVGNDAAPIHIATAVKTPTISLFGPTDWRVWAPRRELDRVIAAEFPCMPCGHSKPDCHLGENYCMSTIDLEDVWNALQDSLSRSLGEGDGT
jgi:predicted lipopolysaccharide heptosyltransferase III